MAEHIYYSTVQPIEILLTEENYPKWRSETTIRAFIVKMFKGRRSRGQQRCVCPRKTWTQVVIGRRRTLTPACRNKPELWKTAAVWGQVCGAMPINDRSK